VPTVSTSDGVKLNYTDEGAGPPVVLIGGGGMAASAWGLQREALAHDFRVLALDRRGHGASDTPDHGSRMARHGKDVMDFLDSVELTDVLLIGASMGASVIWSFVDLFGNDRLRGIVSIDQTPKMINEGDWTLGMYDLTWSSLERFVASFPVGYQPFHKVPPPEVLELFTRDPGSFSLDAFRPLLRDHAVQDWRDVLPLVDVPVLVIAGRHSPFWPWESSAFIADQVQKGDLLILEDSGHAPFLEEHEAVNEALKAFAG
jgi:pimeloyl-ACP methyl ester carboxylesterase